MTIQNIHGLNKLTIEESSAMVEAFREAYVNFSPEDKIIVDKARRTLIKDKRLRFGPLGADELICATLLRMASQRKGKHERN